MTATPELLQTLIRNRCVNDGSPGSGGESRNADVLAIVERSLLDWRLRTGALADAPLDCLGREALSQRGQ